MKVDLSTNMWDITKSIVIIALVIFVFWRVPNMFDNAVDKFSRPAVDETTITKIAENIVRVQLVENNKELTKLIKEMAKANSEALAAIKSNNEKIMELGVVVSSFGGDSASSAGEIVHEDSTAPEKTLVDTLVYTTVGKDMKLPTARVFYSPNAPEGVDKWGTQTFPLDYYTTIFETVDEEGNENRYVEAWIQNDFIPDSRGKHYPVDIKEVKWAKRREPKKKLRFHPRLGFTGIFGITEFYPAIDASLASYGTTKRDMDWRFLDFSIGGTSEDMYLGITPVSYNLGNFLNFVENTFIGVSAATDQDLNYNYGMSLSIPF